MTISNTHRKSIVFRDQWGWSTSMFSYQWIWRIHNLSSILVAIGYGFQFHYAEGVSLAAPGVRINCGGVTLVDGNDVQWQADTGFGTAGRAVDIRAASKGVSIYNSLRLFGPTDGPINSYNLELATILASHYLVRLHFVELILSYGATRSFDVYISGKLLLKSYKLTGWQGATAVEFYIPATTDSSTQLHVTFVRGPVGDPSIAGIEIIPANDLYSPAVGTILMPRVRMSASSAAAIRLDQVGRTWIAGASSLVAGLTAPKGVNINSTALPHTVAGTSSAPLYLPQALYIIAETASAGLPLSYSFTVPSNQTRVLRLHFAELVATSAGQRELTVWINGATRLHSFDVAAAIGIKIAGFRDLVIAPSDQDTLTVSITAGSHQQPFLSGLELLDQIESSILATLLATSSPPTVQLDATQAPSRDTMLLEGVGLGVAAFLLALVALLSGVFLISWLKQRSMVVESGDESPSSSGKQEASWLGALIGLEPELRRGSFLHPMYRLLTRRLSGKSEASGLASEQHEPPLLEGDKARRSQNNSYVKTRIFSLMELAQATGNFSCDNLLGSGGFGQVFRAQLPGGLQLAVKRLSLQSQQGQREFLNEVEMLSRLHHRHLVNLLGFCAPRGDIEGSQPMLVYEFAPAGSLHDLLHKADESPSWSARVKVALGAARGLAYLHQGAWPPVIHRDIKASNILLMHLHEAKVADFGLSKLGKAKTGEGLSVEQSSTAIKGTIGYMDPLYYRNNRLTEKSDVYSFGVVLLELLTGRLPVWKTGSAYATATSAPLSSATSAEPVATAASGGVYLEDEEVESESLVEWAQPALEADNIRQLAAPSLLEGSTDVTLRSLQSVARIAHRCIMPQAEMRPSMTEVVTGLEDAAVDLGIVFSAAPLAAQDDDGAKPSASNRRQLSSQLSSIVSVLEQTSAWSESALVEESLVLRGQGMMSD